MKLSIIIPAYNVEKCIISCLNSLYNQNISEEDYELIIVNDGSTDNTQAIAIEYAKKHSNIIVHTQKNVGLGATRNKGLDLAKGEYVYIIDPDDYLAKGSIDIILKVCDKNNVEILTFNSLRTESYMLLDSYTSNKKIEKLEIFTGIEYMGKKNYKNESWWYIINREFLINTGMRFITGRWMEDAIFTASLFLKTNRMAHIDLDVHRYVRTPNSAMMNTEETHFKKVIYDNANAAVVYHDLIKSTEPLGVEKTIKRMKVRKESFVFFLIARAMRSTLKFNQVWEILKEMKSIEAYPLKNFTTLDYTAIKYKLISPIFNNKILLLISFKFYRTIKTYISK